jgi:hypothetical protein
MNILMTTDRMSFLSVSDHKLLVDMYMYVLVQRRKEGDSI